MGRPTTCHVSDGNRFREDFAPPDGVARLRRRGLRARRLQLAAWASRVSSSRCRIVRPHLRMAEPCRMRSRNALRLFPIVLSSRTRHHNTSAYSELNRNRKRKPLSIQLGSCRVQPRRYHPAMHQDACMMTFAHPQGPASGIFTRNRRLS